MGALTQSFVEDVCCNQHDLCYSECSMNKKECENEFFDCLPGIYKTYATLTELFGCNAFDSAKRARCLCVDNNSDIEEAVNIPCPEP